MKLSRMVTDMAIMGEQIIVAFEKGDTEIFEWDKERQEVMRLEHDKGHEHDGDVISKEIQFLISIRH
jgi:hypothetical protein